ncbi:hypothetical protein BD780_002407 [Clostridium tetanomorphum]|uniref:hypothetical protein n=1 Tax=Clostridium tetanomorphum TaxID=1553 RepID=UPI00044C2D5F|nr:hypothetical protein [Clostridium tetanomorphum]KAJ52338.1 hypothetical protein CTM_08371 [Clostridium tetanomorphum DSM 665]MBP1865259.1 hypothetical protein [Clostridium tetanomorphum]NRS85182.1 hypothetical protein [Clostridium tetanomorphum]SQC03109.1 Uncharacterised protein [Clostridium tetanomorphum]
MKNYMNILKSLIKDNDKEKFYSLIFQLSSLALKYINELEDKDTLLQFSNTLKILEEGMKIDDAVVILDIMEYEIFNYINL